MTRRSRVWVVCILLIAAFSVGVSTGPQSGTVGAAGTGRISGVVTSDEQKPIRRAIVTLSGGDRPLSQNVITDDEGRFEFASVAAGRFTIGATRPGYLTVAYGATRPGRPGTSLVLAAGQQIANIRLQLARGAVITGTVRDARGEPVAGISLRVERPDRSGGLLSAAALRTDDRGVYRAFGLTPGTYIVSAVPQPPGAGGLQAPSDGEVEAALRDLQGSRGGTGRTPVTTPPGAPRPPEWRLQTFAPVYYPSALSAEDATPVSLASGEERQGVDIAVRLITTSSVSGTIVGSRPAGNPISLRLMTHDGRMAPATAAGPGRMEPDGSFLFASVVPGPYVLEARVLNDAAARASRGEISLEEATREAIESCVFAATEIAVTGNDISGLSLALHPCPRIVGRIEFAGATPNRPDPTTVNLTVARRVGPNGYARMGLPPRVKADGTFDLGVMESLTPGEYRFLAELPGSAPGRGWWMRSVVMDGIDVSDRLVVISDSTPSTPTVVMTLSDQHPALVGRLETAAQQPAVDYTVVAFATNQEWWAPPFRRVRTTRPAANGEFAFEDLPAGEYFLTALTDIEPDEWQDRAFLTALVGSSVRVIVGENERHTQNLRLAR